MQTDSSQSVSSNAGRTRVANRAKAKQALIDYMRVRGPICFDFGLYRQYNKDLRKLNNKQAWGHFVQRGQFEARFHRWVRQHCACLKPCSPVIQMLANAWTEATLLVHRTHAMFDSHDTSLRGTVLTWILSRFMCDDLASGAWKTPAAGNKTKQLGLCSCAGTEFVPPAKWYLIP